MTGRRKPGVAGLVRARALPALLDLWAVLDAAGEPPPCAEDPDAWFVNGPAEAAPAIAACQRCPALEPCRAFGIAQRERWAVLGGVYFGPRRRTDALPPRRVRPTAPPADRMAVAS